MAEYIANIRDIKFVLFEYLQIQNNLKKYKKFSDFTLEDYEIFITEAYRLAKEVLAPVSQIGDREGVRFEKGKVFLLKQFHDIYWQYANGGWIGASHSPEYNGGGLPLTMRVAFDELFLGANISLCLSAGLTSGVIGILETFGTKEQKDTFTPNLISGKWAGTMCLTEPQAGSDVGASKMIARKIDGNKYLLEGQKIFITNGEQDINENIIHLVLARTEGAPGGTKGLSIFIVPKFRVNPDGSLGEFNDVNCIGIEHKMGIHASPTCTLNFGDNGKCEGYLIGKELEGIKIMFHMMNEARILVGVQGLSLGSAAYLNALLYAQERIQGTDITKMKDPSAPRVPIIKHPDVRRMLMIMKALTEGLRALLYKVGYYKDIALSETDEGLKEKYDDLVGILTPVCKAYGSDMGFKVTDIAMQVYGGYGYSVEYPIEQYLRDARIAQIYEGTNGIQALDLVGRKLVLKQGKLFLTYMDEINTFIDQNKTHPFLGKYISKLEEAKNILGEVTIKLGMVGMQDVTFPALFAYPYLECFGEVTLTHYLLDEAVIAYEKLSEIFKNSNALTPLQKSKLIDENPEAKFYDGKLKSAIFFTSYFLPFIKARAEVIKSGDKTPLEVVF